MQSLGSVNVNNMMLHLHPSNWVTKSMPPIHNSRRTGTGTATNWSASEARISLLFALASQTASLSSRVLTDLYSETAKYIVPPKQFEARNLEQAFMSVPDLETMNFKVLRFANLSLTLLRRSPCLGGTALISMELHSLSTSWLNTCLNIANEKMEMTTPVITRKTTSGGEKMEMTNPVITRKVGGQEKWEMSFVMPSKYGAKLPLPKDPAVRIKEVSNKIVAVSAFSGYVTDEEVKQRESALKDALKSDKEYEVKVGAQVEVAQYNPPFTLPFTRRNEIALEVERRPVSS